jgi:uncharacterized protein YkwD
MPARTRRVFVATLSLAAFAAPQAASAASGHGDSLSHTGRPAAVATVASTVRHHASRHHRAHSAGVACAATATPLDGRHLDVARRSTLCLLNQVRRQHGLGALTSSTSLRNAAFGHSRDMVQHRFFQHGAFVTRIANSGYLSGARSYAVAENIAFGGGAKQTPGKIVDAWMHSAEHRVNILSPTYHDIGVGIAMGTPVGAAGGTYTTDFGLRH